jgi:hypothetical protein
MSTEPEKAPAVTGAIDRGCGRVRRRPSAGHGDRDAGHPRGVVWTT